MNVLMVVLLVLTAFTLTLATAFVSAELNVSIIENMQMTDEISTVLTHG